jgi:eukaryotic-like serine/threonine-protein kinase
MATAALPNIRGYRILHSLGEGGMGQVFLAQDETLERRVAIKVIAQSLAGEGVARSRFLREARSMAGVEHANVVRIYAFGEAEGHLYIVMEYVEGETLAARLTRVTRLTVADAMRIAAEVAQALSAAWRRGIVHRDVKPANILIDAEDRVKVADFGLARAARGAGGSDSDSTTEGLVVGTPHYMSPEQALGEETDFRSDIYSLGIVLFEMLGGQKPFIGRSPVEVIGKQLREPLPSLAQRCPDVPSSVTAVVASMTAKARDDRPASYPDLLQRLAMPSASGSLPPMLTSSMATLARPVAGSPAAAKRPARRRWALALAFALAALLAAAYFGLAARRHAAFTVAVAPFYGPDAESDKEARVLGALLETELNRRLPEDDVDFLGTEQVKTVVRGARAARTLAEKLDADVVVWGEALSFQGEVDLAAHLTTRDGTLIEAGASGAVASGGGAIETRRARATAVADRVAEIYAQKKR